MIVEKYDSNTSKAYINLNQYNLQTEHRLRLQMEDKRECVWMPKATAKAGHKYNKKGDERWNAGLSIGEERPCVNTFRERERGEIGQRTESHTQLYTTIHKNQKAQESPLNFIHYPRKRE